MSPFFQRHPVKIFQTAIWFSIVERLNKYAFGDALTMRNGLQVTQIAHFSHIVFVIGKYMEFTDGLGIFSRRVEENPRLYINVLFTVSLFTVYLAFLVEIWGGGDLEPVTKL